eukprot:s1290_g3.t1
MGFHAAKGVMERAFEPNLNCFNALLHAFARSANSMKAELCLDQMRQAAVEPDHISFNTLISAHERSGNARWKICLSNSCAMAAAKIEHSDLLEHQTSIVEQFREFWMEDHLCDVVLKSSDGAKHRAHAAVLSAASMFFKKLLGGPFLEADRLQQGQPVEIAASKAAVHALLDYIYGGQPEVTLEVGLELLRLAEAYDLTKFAGAIEASLGACLDSIAALKVLQEAHGLHDLKAVCEKKVAEDFETCSQHPGFGKLGASQLARILKREDLGVSREEAVLTGIFKWLKISKDRGASLGMLLQLVDFQSVSVENLLRLDRFTPSGPHSEDLHREVREALRVRQRKRSQSPHSCQPKRLCLRHWTPDLGGSTHASGRKLLPTACNSLCWHEDAIYGTDYYGGILCWKPGDPATQVRQVAGEWSTVTGINDLGHDCDLAVSSTGEVFAADFERMRLVSFHNGSGRLVLNDFFLNGLFYSPSGVMYLLEGATEGFGAVKKLVGSALQTVIDFNSLPEKQRFSPRQIFVTKDEVIYLNDGENSRIVCMNPAESFKPVVVGQIPRECEVDLGDLVVSECGTIFICELKDRKVLAFRQESSTCTEVLQCPDRLSPVALLLNDRSLYVSMADDEDDDTIPVQEGEGIYEYLLPPELQLE